MTLFCVVLWKENQIMRCPAGVLVWLDEDQISGVNDQSKQIGISGCQHSDGCKRQNNVYGNSHH